MNRIDARSWMPASRWRSAGLVLVLLLGGCATPGSDDDESSPGTDRPNAAPPSALDAVADEFVDVFARVDALGPERVAPRVVTLDEPVFTRALEEALRRAGYDADERVDDAISSAAVKPLPMIPLSYSIESTPQFRTITAGMEDVQVRRRYSGSLEAPSPSGPLYVRGVDAERLRGGGTPNDVPETASSASIPTTRPATPDTELPLRELEPELGAAANVSGSCDVAVADGPLLASYRIVNERVLTFPRGSVELDEAIGEAIDREAARFVPATDVFFVTGTSFGSTTMVRGNELLAQGRANLIERELVDAGVPVERILTKGCWAAEASRQFPNRGGVVTLRRHDTAIDG